MTKFKQEVCEVCGEPSMDDKQLPPELQAKVYRPGENEMYYSENNLGEAETFGEDEVDE